MIHSQSKPRTRPLWLLAAAATIAVWAAAIYLAATVPKAIPPFEIPSLCGAWGCTDETNDLVAYHLVWITATVPPVGLLARRYASERVVTVGWRVTWGVTMAVLLAVVGAAMYWRYTFGNASDPWPWRYGLFLMFRNADVPIMPIFLWGVVAATLGKPRQSEVS